MRFLATLIVLAWGSSVGAAAAALAVVAVPIADLRSEPSLPSPGMSDDKEETQLLFGESIEVYESSGDWVRVEAVEQPSFKYHQRWEGYPGWILKSALWTDVNTLDFNYVVTQKWLPVLNAPGGTPLRQLPLGARVQVVVSTQPALVPQGAEAWKEISLPGKGTGWVNSLGLKKWPAALPPAERRDRILRTAALLIGDPYVWGGRSPFDTTHQAPLSGMDCSGLVQLSYAVNGVTIPRDSLEQYMKAQKISRRELAPADLIFSASLDNPAKIIHVMLYAGGGMVLEAPKTGLTVRQISFKEKTGYDLGAVESGQALKDRVIYFGRLL